jgi:hypothetical protein
VVTPEKELITIEEIGEFRMYIENTFSSSLNGVELSVENEAFEIEIEPLVMKKLLPGERAFFLVKLKLKEGFERGDYSLKINVKAQSAELKPSRREIEVLVDKKVNEVKSKKRVEDRKLKRKVLPQKKKISPLVKKPEEETPSIKIDEKPAQEERKEIKSSREGIGKVVVRVEKIPFWKKTYFYIILILILVGILIWRKIK